MINCFFINHGRVSSLASPTRLLPRPSPPSPSLPSPHSSTRVRFNGPQQHSPVSLKSTPPIGRRPLHLCICIWGQARVVVVRVGGRRGGCKICIPPFVRRPSPKRLFPALISNCPCLPSLEPALSRSGISPHQISLSR